jgi:hypothetical protein
MSDQPDLLPERPATERLIAVLKDVACERREQDAKWGVQDHSDIEWSAILGEEIGEACEQVLRGHFGGRADALTLLREELVQCAAVAVAWIECIDRNVQSPTERLT